MPSDDYQWEADQKGYEVETLQAPPCMTGSGSSGGGGCV
jgi:hypothetical protein